MGCAMGVVKYLLFIFNFIFVLCGLAILVIGVLIQVGNNHYSKHLDEITKNLIFPSITLIVIGSIIFIIAFLGCCGAIRESHCMMVTFASLLLTILIIQIAVAIYVFVTLKNSGNIDFRNIYSINLFNHYKDANTEAKEIVDGIQDTLECCGVTGPSDFNTVHHISIPGSCCGLKEETCPESDAYQQGCAEALKDFFKSACQILGGIALGIAAAELIGIIFALCLANSIKNAERRGYSV